MAITPKIFQQMTNLIAGSMSAGRYDVRLAESDQEIQEAQKLRYEVLYKESGGRITKEMLNAEREEDEWDEIAFSNSSLAENQSFYTEHAFNLDGVLNHYKKSLELSRACVSPEGRGGMQFIEQNDFDVLFGCASFSGTDYKKHTEILSYLYDKHLATPELMPVPKDTVTSVAIEDFTTKPGTGKDRGKVPTMLRGYLKVGARISDHAVIDSVFNTTFVVIYVDAKKMFQINHVLVNKSIDH